MQKTFKEVLSESIQKEIQPMRVEGSLRKKGGISSLLINKRLGVHTMPPILAINHSFLTEKRPTPTYTVEAWDNKKYKFELVFSTSNEMEIKDASPHDYSTNKIVVKTWVKKEVVHIREVELSTIF